MEVKRYFNTEGQCDPNVHYMVKIDEIISIITRKYIERGRYFVINRGRQYGKTTTLVALAEHLERDYVVIFMDFQKISTEEFKDEAVFSNAFWKIFVEAIHDCDVKNGEALSNYQGAFSDVALRELFFRLSEVCGTASKPVVMIIDEVDSAANNQVFLDFLAMLRGYYLDRKNKPIFHSVILAGVYDIKNLKLKIRSEEEHKYNSPWNIAAKFNIDMSFSVDQIAFMLREYEEDNHTGMDVYGVSKCIYDYTSGYPYLVSAICKILDEEILENERLGDAPAWTEEGIAEAVKTMMVEKIPLFDSMMRQVSEYPDMKRLLNAILFRGMRVSYNADNPVISLAAMFGYIVNKEGTIQVANRIFEMRLYNFFLSEEELTNAIYNEAQGNKNQFICKGRLDMDLVLDKFVTYFNDIYGENDEKFIEEYGRKFFLLYLKPIINGVGNYYIEARTRDARRTDVIVDYMGEQFIVELKIWRGSEYNERGETQLADYLDYYHQEKGYMLSFNFNKKKEIGVKKIIVGTKVIIEAVV